MSDYKNGQYLIGATGDDFWNASTAKTLTGAKIAASKLYQQAVGGKIKVAVVVGNGDNAEVVEVSRKLGYGGWVDAQ